MHFVYINYKFAFVLFDLPDPLLSTNTSTIIHSFTHVLHLFD